MKKTYMNKLLALVAVMAFAMTYVQAQTFTVDAPASIAGEYNVGLAGYGPQFGADFSGPVTQVTDASGETTACVEITDDLSGTVALIDRGACGFTAKTLSAQAAGAIGVIICNNDQANPDSVIALGGSDGCLAMIPTVMLSYNDCQTLRMETGVSVSYTQPGIPPAGWSFGTAIDVTEGTYTVDSIPTNGNTFTNATGELWYKYTAPADGVLNISSCDSPTATRAIVTVHPLGCAGDLVISAFAAGNCPDNDGSVIDLLVLEGGEYYIIWDNAGSSDGFDFTLTQGVLPDVGVTFNVDMQNETVSADGVNMVIAGPGVTDVADVGIVPMSDDDGDGIYSATVDVTTLDTVGYAFVNGGVDPANVEVVADSCGVPSGFGFNVRPLINNSINPFSVDAVCFASCEACPLEVATCDEPTVIWLEDFEAQTVGEPPVNNFIIPWPAAGIILGDVSSDQAASGSNSHLITGDGTDVDPVYLLTGQTLTTGHYLVSWNMYIPGGSTAYYNFQKDATPAVEWAVEVFFNGDGTGELFAGDVAARAGFTYPVDEWFPIVQVIDIDNDLIRVHINGRWVSSWPLNFDASSAGNLQSIGSVNYYPRPNEADFWYVDDFLVAQLPEPAEELYCQTATAVEPGVITAGDLDCFGGGIFYDTDDDSGLQSRWYAYTPTEDGYINVSSCGAPADTRTYIMGGDCGDLVLLGTNDDRCDMSTGDPYASLAEAPVTAGETYYIVWDDYWDELGFDWELTFTAGALPEINFCASALAVTPGSYTTDAFGEASVAGGALGASTNSASAVFAPQQYAGAAWYSFTPESDGLMTISSCDDGADTYLFVYTGTCDHVGTLEVVAESDDDCIVGSLVEEFEVTAGTTYFIEWIDLYTADAFDWELNYSPPTVNVQMAVDVSILVDAGELSAEGVFVAGSFSDFNNVEMTDVDGDNIYTVTVQIPENSTATYKFKNGPDGWENIDTSLGDNCTTGDFNDRFVEVGTMNIPLDPVCFGYCVTCNIVDVDEVALEQGVSVFPNPAKDVLNVQVDLPEMANRLNIRLVNALGQVVLSRDLGQLQSDNIELDVRNLAAGTYMLQVVDGQAQFTQSVVIR
ncbi:MAG: T9SS type A sorting domain-containing protein [Phaeodactylibacter sp.]|uniref:T9SS type A sorting domain-containing protein n=1 Tax=Phaeodactylibacter sp. TaxID=1940289 RepID=UPI0032EDD435